MNKISLLLQKSLLLQFLLISIIWLAGRLITFSLNLSFLGNLVGLILLFLLISKKIIALKTVDRAAKILLLEMPLFLIPAILAITIHPEFFGFLGLKILAVIFIGTLAVMLVTAMIVDLSFRRKEGEKIND